MQKGSGGGRGAERCLCRRDVKMREGRRRRETERERERGRKCRGRNIEKQRADTDRLRETHVFREIHDQTKILDLRPKDQGGLNRWRQKVIRCWGKSQRQ